MNTEITIPVRVQVLRDSIAELQSQLSNLDVNSSSFKTLNKYIQSMTQEMTKFEAMTSRSFGSQTQFNKANKSVEKMEDTLAKARIAMNDIKFPELKLSGAQQKEWDNLNNALDAAMKKFDNVKEKFKQGLLSDTGTSRLFETIDPKAMDKSYDELFNLIDNKTQKVGKKLAESKDKLDDFLLKKDSAHKRGSLLAGEGFTPESLGQAAFDKFFTKAANGALSFKITPGQQGGATHKAFVDFLKSEYSLGDKEVNDLLKYTTAPSLNSFVKKMGKQSNMFTRGWDAANFDQQHALEQQVKDVEAAYNNYQEVLQKFSDASFTGDQTKAAGEIGEAYNKLQNELAGLNSKMKDFQENAVKGFKQGNIQQSLTAYQNELNNFKNTLASTNAEFLKLEQTKRTFSNMKMAISNFMGFYQVLNLTKRGVREAMTHIKDLDSVMNKISIVTDKSTSDLWGQVDAYSDMAQKYGVSIKGAYEVSQIYYQQGLDTSDVLTLTNETLKLSKISGLDYATTTDYMTTAMRGFKMETSDASRVVDVYSNLAAHTAVSQGELAVGMSKTASSLESVGASFEESSAMIATMVAVTRESSTNIGSAMKSIASRYGEMKKDMSAAFDAEGEALSYNKVDAALQSVGISLKDSSGQFRNMTDVIIELGEQWDTLDSVQQRYIATQFAGNRQQSRFLALVSNVDLLKSNLNYALDSENVGDVQALKALDSIESRTEQLKVAYQQMYTTIGAEDMWKGALSGLTNFMNTLNGMPKLFDKIPIGAAAMLYDVVNVIRSVGNKALEGVSSGILSGLMNDKDIAQKAAGFIQQVNQNLEEEQKKQAPKTKEVGANTANTMAEGAKDAQKDENQPAAKPKELEKVAEPAKQEAQEVIKNEEIKAAIEPIQQPVELVPNKEALAQDTKEAIEAGTQAANTTPEKQVTEVTDVQKQAIASQISELTQEVKVTVTADTGPAETAISNLNGKTITVNVDANTPSLGVSGGRFGGAVGGAYATGTKKLLGELGPEMYVTNGHYYVAGTNGPEMIDLPDDAIVFNHLQTEDLLKKNQTATNGKPITSERKSVAMASGNLSLEEILAQIKEYQDYMRENPDFYEALQEYEGWKQNYEESSIKRNTDELLHGARRDEYGLTHAGHYWSNADSGAASYTSLYKMMDEEMNPQIKEAMQYAFKQGAYRWGGFEPTDIRHPSNSESVVEKFGTEIIDSPSMQQFLSVLRAGKNQLERDVEAYGPENILNRTRQIITPESADYGAKTNLKSEAAFIQESMNSSQYALATNGPFTYEQFEELYKQKEELEKSAQESIEVPVKPQEESIKETGKEIASGVSEQTEKTVNQLNPSKYLLNEMGRMPIASTNQIGAWETSLFGAEAQKLIQDAQVNGFSDTFTSDFVKAVSTASESGEIDLAQTLKHIQEGLVGRQKSAEYYANGSGLNDKLHSEFLSEALAKDTQWLESLGLQVPEDSARRHQQYLIEQSYANRVAQLRKQGRPEDYYEYAALDDWRKEKLAKLNKPEENIPKEEATISQEEPIDKDGLTAMEEAERVQRKINADKAEAIFQNKERQQEQQVEQDRIAREAEQNAEQARIAVERQAKIDEFNSANTAFLSAIGKPKSTDWTAGIPIEDAVRLRKQQAEAKELMLQQSGVPRTPSAARIAAGQLSGPLSEQWDSQVWRHWTTRNGNFVGQPLSPNVEYGPTITPNAQAGYLRTMDNLKAEAELIRRGESVHPQLGASLTLSALEERERYAKEVAEYEKRQNKETKSETPSKEKSRLEQLQRVQELRAAIKTKPKDIDDLKEERNKLYDSLGDVNAKTANADIAKKIAIEQRKEAIAADKQKLIDMHKGNKELMRKLLPSDDNQLRSAAEHSANPEIRYEALKQLRNELNNTSEASKNMMDKEQKAIDKTVNAQEQLNDERQEGQKEAQKSTAAVDNLKEEKKAADQVKESENDLKETQKEKEIETAEDFKNKYEYDASSDQYSRKDNKGLALSSEEFEKALSKKQQADAEREFTNKYEYDSDADLYRAKNSQDKDLEPEEYQEQLNSVRDAAAEPIAPSIVPDVSALETAREKAEEPIKPPVVPDMTEADEKLDSWSNKLKNSLQYKGNTALGGQLSQWGSGLNMLTGLIKGDSQEALTAKGGLMAGSGIMKLVGGWMTGSPMAIATGLMNVISGVSTIIEDDTEKLQRLNKTAEELNNKAKQEKANYKTLENSIKKVNELEKKRYESEEAAEEYQNAVDNLTDKFPELIDGFDEFGNAIPDMISAEESLAEARKNSAQASYDAARAELEALEQQQKINFQKARETGSELSSYQFTTGTEEAIASDVYQRDQVESIIKASPDWMQNMYGNVTAFSSTTWNAALREEQNPNSALINLLYGAKGQSTFGTGDSFKEEALNNLFNNILAPYINEEIGGMEGLNLQGMRDALSNLKPEEFSQEASDFLTFLDSYLNTMNNLEEAQEAGGSSTVLKDRIDEIKNVDLKARLQDSEKAIDDISIINEAVESYNKALETDDFDLITKNYEYLEDVITELQISEDDNANYLNQYLGDIRSQMGTVGNSIKNIASTKSQIAAMQKKEASEWFKSTYKEQEFVQEASGLTSIVTNALVEQWQAAFDTGETTDDLTTWLNNNVKDSKALADEANNLWLSIKDKMVDGELVSDNLTKMLNEPEHYNSNDIINYLSQVDAEIGDSLQEYLVQRSLKWSNRVQDSLMKHINSLTEDRESENLNQLKRYIEDEGEFGQLTNYDRNYFTSVSNQIKTLENRGFTSLASAFLNNATELFGEIGLLEDKAAQIAIFDSITKNGFQTAENISKIMKSATSAGVKEDSRLYSSLQNIYKMVSSNLQLAITAATDEFISTWGDSSKVLKKLTSGIEFTEATDLMALAEKIQPAELGQENTLLNIKDFKTNGSQVALTSDKAIEFWNSYNDYMSLQSKNWETDLSNAAKNLSKLLNLPENTDLSQIQFSDEDIELLQDSLNNEEIRTWIQTVLGNTYDSVISEVEENGQIGYEFKDNLQISEITDIFNQGLTSTYNLIQNYNKYREFAANQIIKSLNWDKGDYSSLQKTFQKQGVENYTSRLKQLASGARYEDWELNEPDIKNAVDKMTDGYSGFLSDVLEKGTENINIKQYEGILQEDASRIANQLSADMDVSDFVSQYYQAAGWTIEEANSKIIEANRKAREKSYDEIKELSNISKAGQQLDLTYTTQQLDKQYQKNLKLKRQELQLAKHYGGTNEQEVVDLQEELNKLEITSPLTELTNVLSEAGAILENGILTLTSKANMSAIADALAEASKQVGSGMAAELMDMAQDIQKKYIDYINNGIEGKATYTEATDLMRYAKANGATFEEDAFYQTADGLKLSTEAAISLYSTLDNVSAVQKSIVFDSLTKQLKENNKHYKDAASILARIGELNKQIDDITQDADESHQKLKETMEQELAIAKEMALSNYTTPNSSWDFSQGGFTSGEMTNMATYYSTWARYMESMSQWSTTGRIDYDGFINLLGHVSEMAQAIGQIDFMGKTFTKNGLIDGQTLDDIQSVLFSALRSDKNGTYFDKKVLSSMGFKITKGSTMMEGMYDYINAFLGVSTEDAENWNDIMDAFMGVDQAMKDSIDHKTIDSFFDDGIFNLDTFSSFLQDNKLTDQWNEFADNFYIGNQKLSDVMGNASIFNQNAETYSKAIKGIFQMLQDEEGWDKTKPLQSLAQQLERFGIEEGEYHFGDKVLHIKNGKVIIQVDDEEGGSEYTDSNGNTVSATSPEEAINKLKKAQAEDFRKQSKELGANITDLGDKGKEGFVVDLKTGPEITVRYDESGGVHIKIGDGQDEFTDIQQALDKAYEEFGNGMEKSEWYQSEGFQLDLDSTGQSIFKAFTGQSGELIGQSLGKAIVNAMTESEITIPALNLSPESINVDTDNIKPSEVKDYTVEGGTVTIKPKAVVIEGPEEEEPSETETEETVAITADASSVDAAAQAVEAIPEEKDVQIQTSENGLDVISAMYNSITDKNVTIGINTSVTGGLGLLGKWFGIGEAKGNVAISGAAHAQSTLMGELGPEMVVSNGRYFVVGQNGPEFVDLEKDAIVFNHLQTKSLLEKGTSNTRGKAITNERVAISYAKGSLSGGPAHGEKSKIIVGKQDAETVLSGQTGSKLKTLMEGLIKALDKWYNLLQEIAKIQAKLNKEEALRAKIQSDLNKSGTEYYKSQKRSIAELEKEVKTQQELVDAQKKEREKRVSELKKGKAPFSKMYEVDEDGQVKMKSKFKSEYDKYFGDTDTGKPKKSIKQQYDWLKKQFGAKALAYDSNGKEIEFTGDEEKDKAAMKTAIEAALKRMEAQKDEVQGLTDSINDHEKAQLEAEQKRNELLKDMRDNQMSLENKVLDAIVDMREREIEEQENLRDAIEESANKFIDGLSNALNKERQMYDMEDRESDLRSKQRRLAVLQRTGGSGSEIASLESEIESSQRDLYFEKQQEQIDSIKEASDKEIERMDLQIDLMKEQLEYEKAHGLLWNDVYTIMQQDSETIANFIMTNDSEWWNKSAVKTQQDLADAIFEAEQWKAFVEDITGEDSSDTESEDEEDGSKKKKGKKKAGKNTKYKVTYTDENGKQQTRYFDSKEDAKAFKKEHEGAKLSKYKNENTSGGNTQSGTIYWLYEGKKYPSKAAAEAARSADVLDAQQHGTSAEGVKKRPITRTYEEGGLSKETGPAILHGTKIKPEAVLTAHQTSVLRDKILSRKPDSLMSLLTEFQATAKKMASGSTYSSIDRSATTSIGSMAVNMNVKEIANDYDAKRAGEQAMEEMLRIARKTNVTSLRR